MPKPLLFAIAALSLSFLAPSPARAYDEDTHFYGTYAMARHAGIKHEVAVKIALSAQWMDESFISDPTSMIFLPVTGVKKRRLLHFPSSRLAPDNATVERQIMGFNDLGEFSNYIMEKVAAWAGVKTKLSDVNIFTKTDQDDPVANQMLMEGIREGNLMKAATGIHTLEDSFAHAGTPAGSGHAMWWHWPDRPFAKDSLEKYQRMTHSVFAALVGIRTLLPRAALDCGLKTAGSPNCETDSERLAETYLPLVTAVYSHDVTRDPRYVGKALGEAFERAKAKGYTQISRADFDARASRLQLVDGQTNSFDALAQLFKSDIDDQAAGKSGAFDYQKILAAMRGLNSASSAEILNIIDNYGFDGMANWQDRARLRFAGVVSEELLAWHVPDDIDGTHRYDLEDDKDELRKYEMELRVQAMQAFIQKNWGIDLQFVANNTSDDVGFYREIHLDPAAAPNYAVQPGFQARPGAVYATFSLQEKNQFDRNILSYLYPRMKQEHVFALIEAFAKIKVMLMKQSEYYAKMDAIDKKYDSFILREYHKALLGAQYHRVRWLSANKAKAVDIAVREIEPYAQEYVNDLLTSHIKAGDEPGDLDKDVFAYRRAVSFRALIEAGKAKPFLTDADFWHERELLAPAAPASFFSGLFQ